MNPTLAAFNAALDALTTQAIKHVACRQDGCAAADRIIPALVNPDLLSDGTAPDGPAKHAEDKAFQGGSGLPEAGIRLLAARLRQAIPHGDQPRTSPI